jgi:hypothetical protein
MSPVIRQRVNQPSCSLFNIYIYIRHFFSFVNKENNSSITRIPTTPSNEIASCIYVNGNDYKITTLPEIKKTERKETSHELLLSLLGYTGENTKPLLAFPSPTTTALSTCLPHPTQGEVDASYTLHFWTTLSLTLANSER